MRAASGYTAREVLDNIWMNAYELQRQQADLFGQEVLPDLVAQGIQLLRWDQLTPQEKSETERFFDAKVFPVLTPLSRSTRRTRSRTSAACPSTSPSSCAIR